MCIYRRSLEDGLGSQLSHATADACKIQFNTVHCNKVSVKRVSKTALNFSGFDNCYQVHVVWSTYVLISLLKIMKVRRILLFFPVPRGISNKSGVEVQNHQVDFKMCKMYLPSFWLVWLYVNCVLKKKLISKKGVLN